MRSGLAPVHWPPRSIGTDVVLALLLGLVLSAVSLELAREPNSVASVWFPNGAAIALAASAAPRRRPGLLLLVALGLSIFNGIYYRSLSNVLAFLPGNLVEMGLGTYLLVRFGAPQRVSTDANDLLKVLVLGALLPPLMGALVGALLLDVIGFLPFSAAWVDWFISSAIGSAVTIPLVLALRSRSSLHDLLGAGGWLVMTLVTLGTMASFVYLPNPFAVVIVVLLAVAFLQPRLVSFACAPLVVVGFSVAIGHGWYVPTTANTPIGHLSLYMTLLLALIPAQVVAVIVARKRALDQILSVVGGQADQLAVFVDMQGVLRWANKARALYWDVPNDECIGESWLGTLPAQQYRQPMQRLLDQAMDGRAVNEVMDMEFPARGHRTMAVHLEPGYDEDRHQIGVLYTSTDITDIEGSRRQLEGLAGSLKLSNADLEHFVRVSSHDLREPLNTIQQFSGLIEDDAASALSPEARAYFRLVRSAASRMGTMLEDVRLFVQVDERAPDQAFAPVDLDALVDGALTALHERLQPLGAVVQVGPLGTFRGDEGQLQLAVQNLLGNAIKFMPPGRAPAVQITAQRLDGELWLTIADNGIGIEPGHLGQLGQPFKRLHARREYEGTGLGLATCVRVARKHGGRLAIASTPGEGSRFSLVMPVAA